MIPRLNYPAVAPDALEPLAALERQLRGASLEHGLMYLVKLRASQINGCAYCLHMHAREARKAGEAQERLDVLAAWRESPLFTDRERAALGWTETLTRLAETGAPDGDYQAMRREFGEREAVDLTLLIGAINIWNRLAVGFRSVHPVSPDARPAAAEAAAR